MNRDRTNGPQVIGPNGLYEQESTSSTVKAIVVIGSIGLLILCFLTEFVVLFISAAVGMSAWDTIPWLVFGPVIVLACALIPAAIKLINTSWDMLESVSAIAKNRAKYVENVVEQQGREFDAYAESRMIFLNRGVTPALPDQADKPDSVVAPPLTFMYALPNGEKIPEKAFAEFVTEAYRVGFVRSSWVPPFTRNEFDGMMQQLEILQIIEERRQGKTPKALIDDVSEALRILALGQYDYSQNREDDNAESLSEVYVS